MIEISPYASIGGAAFGSSEGEALLLLGEPLQRKKNASGKVEMHYANFIARFDSQGLMEGTFLPGCVASLLGRRLTWDKEFLAFLSQRDQEMVEAVGFVTSLKFGISAVGLHQEDDIAIHAFRRGLMDSLLDRVKPFSLPDC